jgi:hypothetical protein
MLSVLVEKSMSGQNRELRVPADAPPASEVSIHLTATADATASIGGFNGALKTFTVSRE